MAINPVDVAKAKAFSLFVKNIIGEEPTMLVTDNRVEITFSEDQKNKLISWLDQQVGGVFGKKQESGLFINFGDVLFPWAIRYIVPTAGAVFVTGYLTNGWKRFSRRFR